jgi:hypothetical protein
MGLITTTVLPGQEAMGVRDEIVQFDTRGAYPWIR